MKTRTSRLVLLLLTLLAVVFCAPPVFANQWDAVPELDSRQNVAIRTGFDGPRYNSLRTCLRRFDSQADVNYFGALVAVTEPSGDRSRDFDDASEYAEFVAREWADEGRVDLDNDVVVALGFRNRSIGVYVGQQWRTLGLTDEDIADSIAASPFPAQMRRQGYNDAMCSVANALDVRLATLRAAKNRESQRAAEEFPPATERYAAVRQRVEESLVAENQVRARLLDEIGAAEDLLNADEKTDDAPHEVLAAAQQIHQISDDVEADLDHYLQRIEPLDDLEARVEAAIAGISDRSDESWSGVVAAGEILDGCRQQVAQARLAESPELIEIQECIQGAETELARSEVRHFFLARALPTTILFLLILAALTFVFTRLLRRRRALQILRADLETWTRGLQQGQEKLQRLQTEFPWYFSDRAEFWDGESAEFDQQIADGINRAFLFQSQGVALLDQARTLHGKSKLLNVGKLEKALKVLRKTPVAMEAGTTESGRPLPLPITERVESTASELLNDLDAAFFAALDGLKVVAPVQQQIADLMQEAETAFETATVEIGQRKAQNLPVDHLQRGLNEAQGEWSQAAQRAQKLPAEGSRSLESAVEKLEAVCARARRGNEVLHIVDEEVGELRRQVAALLQKCQRSGITFGEADFEPEQVTESAVEQLTEIRELVATGQEDRAHSLLEPLVEELEHTALRLSVALEGANLIPVMVKDITALQPKMKEPLFHLRMQLQRLEVDEEVVAEHVDELSSLQKLVHRLERHIKGISSTHSDGKPLTAVADLATLVSMLEGSAESLVNIQNFIGEFSDDDVPPVPPEPIWHPPQVWGENPASAWGKSEDADPFRSPSLSGRRSSAKKRRPLPSLS